MRWFWLDTGWACGGVLVDLMARPPKVVKGAPIFRKFVGTSLANLYAVYGEAAVIELPNG